MPLGGTGPGQGCPVPIGTILTPRPGRALPPAGGGHILLTAHIGEDSEGWDEGQVPGRRGHGIGCEQGQVTLGIRLGRPFSNLAV